MESKPMGSGGVTTAQNHQNASQGHSGRLKSDRLLRYLASEFTANSFKGWKPIESAPANERVILFIPASALIPRGIRRSATVRIGSPGLFPNATHWQPLPDPPRDLTGIRFMGGESVSFSNPKKGRSS